MKMPPRSDEPSPQDAALDALFSDARAETRDTSRAEYGFETRLMARLRSERAEQTGWREFATWCWRLLPGFAAVTLAFTIWTVRTSPGIADEPVFAAAFHPAAADDDDLMQWLSLELLAPI